LEDMEGYEYRARVPSRRYCTQIGNIYKSFECLAMMANHSRYSKTHKKCNDDYWSFTP